VTEPSITATGIYALFVFGGLAIIFFSLRVRKRGRDSKAFFKWTGGDSSYKEEAVKFLNTLGTVTLARYLTMLVEDPKAWEFRQYFREDLSDYYDYQAVLVDISTGGTITFWYDISRTIKTQWSTKGKKTASLELPHGAVVVACTKLNAQGERVLRFTETIYESNKNIDFVKYLLVDAAGKGTSDIIDQAHKTILELLSRHQEEAVKYLNDPIIGEGARKIMEGTYE